MLETALNQLTHEQNLRKESDNKLMEAELEMVNKEHRIKSLEEQLQSTLTEKDEKIISLDNSVNFLQTVVIEKEKEILSLQEELASRQEVSGDSVKLNKTCEKFEETLSRLLGESRNDETQTVNCDEDETVTADSQADSNMEVEEVNYLKEGVNEEEFQLTDTLAELNSEAPLEVDVKPDIKVENEKRKWVRHKTTCPICGENFVNKYALTKHQKDTDHVVKFNCELCDKQFKTKSIMQIHKARIHSDATPYKCGKCEKRFKDAGSCRRHEANDSVHIRNESMKNNPSLMCNICGKEFDRNRRWCLDQHYLTHIHSKAKLK